MAAVDVGGVAYFYVDGQLYDLKGNFKVKLGGLVRTPVPGVDGSVHFTCKYVEPSIEAELFDKSNLAIVALKQLTDSTVQIRMNNGKIYQLYDAFQVDDPDIDAAQGMFPIKFSGTRCQELVVNS